MTRRGSRGSTDALVTIYWRDIPAQINATSDGRQARALLSDRFQHAIDRAATVADATDTDTYVAQWRKLTQPIAGPAEAAAEAERARLEAVYDAGRLEDLVWAGGVDEDRSPFRHQPDPPPRGRP